MPQASVPLQVGLVIDLTNTDRYYGTGDLGNEFAYHQQQFDGEPIHHIKAGACTAALLLQCWQGQNCSSHASSVLQIRCRGRGQAPDPTAANEFCWALVDFGLYLKEADLKRWVVVHCTHGYNRSGRWFCQVSAHLGMGGLATVARLCTASMPTSFSSSKGPVQLPRPCSLLAQLACGACLHSPGRQPTGWLIATQAL